jgi:hypothetical protein
MRKFKKLIPIEGEQWRSHPFIEDVVCCPDGRIGNRRRMILYSGSKSQDGYLIICFSRPEYTRSWAIHTLIAQTFIGLSSLTVNHKDGNKENNSVDNLEYLSRADNVRHAVATGLRKNRSTNVHNSNFDEFKVLAVATYHNAGFGQLLISEIFNVSRGSVRSMTTGYTYSEFKELFKKLPRDTHGKYTARAIKENKWIINNGESA